jgi:formylmethanofuran dehydrogenase subunit E
MEKIVKCGSCGVELVRDTEHIPEDGKFLCFRCFRKSPISKGAVFRQVR